MKLRMMLLLFCTPILIACQPAPEELDMKKRIGTPLDNPREMYIAIAPKTQKTTFILTLLDGEKPMGKLVISMYGKDASGNRARIQRVTAQYKAETAYANNPILQKNVTYHTIFWGPENTFWCWIRGTFVDKQQKYGDVRLNIQQYKSGKIYISLLPDRISSDAKRCEAQFINGQQIEASYDMKAEKQIGVMKIIK